MWICIFAAVLRDRTRVHRTHQHRLLFYKRVCRLDAPTAVKRAGWREADDLKGPFVALGSIALPGC